MKKGERKKLLHVKFKKRTTDEMIQLHRSQWKKGNKISSSNNLNYAKMKIQQNIIANVSKDRHTSVNHA